MNDRRITPKTDNEREDRLKQIAGLIKRLTYSEMKAFADHMHQAVDTPREDLEDQIIKLSERILTPTNGAFL